MGRFLQLSAFAACLGLSAGVFAQDDDEARVHFRLGQAYYDSGRFEDAAREFQQAYDLSQRPQLLYNVFIAWRDAAQLGPAIQSLEAYLRLVPDARDRDSLEARLASMRRLHQQQEAARAANQRETQTTTTTATTTPPTETTTTTSTEPAESTESPETVAATEETTEVAIAPADPDDEGGGSVLPWVVIGAGGAMVLVGALTGVMALSAESDLEEACPMNACTAADWADTRDSGQTLATLTDVLFVVGGITAAAGVALLFLLDDGGSVERDPSTMASAACTGDGCAVSVQTSF